MVEREEVVEVVMVMVPKMSFSIQFCNELAQEKNTQDTVEKENDYSMVVNVVNQTRFLQ